MVSFGNASGPLEPINVPKTLQPKGLFFVRPSMGQYLQTREELEEASKVLFEKISSEKVKVEIKYSSGEIKKIETLCRIDTKNELEYYKNGGILQYVLRNMI